jgi:hypothetical protein
MQISDAYIGECLDFTVSMHDVGLQADATYA